MILVVYITIIACYAPPSPYNFLGGSWGVWGGNLNIPPSRYRVLLLSTCNRKQSSVGCSTHSQHPAPASASCENFHSPVATRTRSRTKQEPEHNDVPSRSRTAQRSEPSELVPTAASACHLHLALKLPSDLPSVCIKCTVWT